MTTVSGNNAVYLGKQIHNSRNSAIIRISTTDSNDTFEDASNILYQWMGYTDSDRIGETMPLVIKNGSDFIISLSPGSGMTMDLDIIPPKATSSYIIIKTSETTIKLIKTSTGSEKDSVGTFLKDINVYGTVFDYKSVSSIVAAQGISYTSGQLFGGYIKRTIDDNYTDFLPSASSIIGAIKYPKIGTSFHCYVQVISNGVINKSLTINGSVDTTISGTDNIFSKNTTVLLLFTITNITLGSEAITCYIMGILGSSVGGNASSITNVSTPVYSMLTTDNTLNVNTALINTACTITLPLISTVGQKRYFITDSTGKANKFNIRIIPSGSDKIVGTNLVTINSSYSSISMYNDEVSNWILY